MPDFKKENFMRILCFFIMLSIFSQEVAAFCEVFIRRYEQKHGIPDKLLSAISLIESGQKRDGHFVAWPWSINANGTPYVFDTKQEAVNKVKELQAQGITSIDVGCMQINLKHHPNAFKSVEEAFDPEKNIAYAASFLEQKKAAQGNWTHAVAHYHSATQSLGDMYKEKVLGTWKKILNQDDLPNVYEMVNKPAVVRVPMVGIGRRYSPINVRFSPFKHFDGRPIMQKKTAEGERRSIYNIRHSKGLDRARIATREKRIPLEIFSRKDKNPYSLKNSSRM